MTLGQIDLHGYTVYPHDITTQIKNINSLSNYEEILKKEIKIFKIGMAYPVPTNSNVFNILIHSSPNIINVRPYHSGKSRLFDIKYNLNDYNSFETSFTGEGRIIYDDSGYPVGEVINNNLYIIHPLTTFLNDKSTGIKILLKILDKVCNTTIIPQEEFKKDDKFTSAFIDFCKNLEFRKHKGLTSDVDNLRKKVEKISGELHQAVRELKYKERELFYYSSDAEIQNAAYKQELERIKNIEKIKNVKFDGKIIEVITKDIYCENPDTTHLHHLGEFNIKINLSGNVSLRFINLTQQINGFNAPHVDPTGHPCMGNFAEVLSSLVSRNEFAAIIIMSIKFLESVETNDGWGRRIVNWPLASTVNMSVVKNEKTEFINPTNAIAAQGISALAATEMAILQQTVRTVRNF